MKNDLTSTRRLNGIVVAVLIFATGFEVYMGIISILGAIPRLFPIYLSIGSWHILRDMEKNKKTNPSDIITWVARYLPKKK